MRYEGYPNDFLDGHQILYAVGGHLFSHRRDSPHCDIVYCLINRSRSLYSYAKNILEDMGYKGYNIKIFFLLILAILIKTPFDSDFKIVPLRIL